MNTKERCSSTDDTIQGDSGDAHELKTSVDLPRHPARVDPLPNISRRSERWTPTGREDIDDESLIRAVHAAHR